MYIIILAMTLRLVVTMNKEKRYQVKVSFIYSDVVTVRAKNEAEAKGMALEISETEAEYHELEKHFNSVVTEIDENGVGL